VDTRWSGATGSLELEVHCTADSSRAEGKTFPSMSMGRGWGRMCEDNKAVIGTGPVIFHENFYR
jgi:hypothetical protein